MAVITQPFSREANAKFQASPNNVKKLNLMPRE
jgi:hypothetical protein